MNNFNEDVGLAVKGDADAFARLYSTVYKELYRVALCSLRNPQDAQDAVSDAVLDAFASVKKLRDEDAFKAWIFAILSAKIKRKQKEYMNAPDNVENMEIATTPDFADSEIGTAMNSLAEDERLVLSLSAIGGYKSAEIAQMCRMNASTVRSKISRAREKLARLLFIEKGDYYGTQQ